MTETASFIDDSLLRVGPFEFDCAFPFNEPSGRIQVMKTRALVEDYMELFESLRPKRIFELGIRRGGSTALLHALASPEKLVSIELSAGAPMLAEHIHRHGLGDTVRPHYGVDQGDQERIEQLILTEFQGRALDFVVDDASHRYGPTVASFEVVFPHLRPGGVYVIEDWNGMHLQADAIDRFLATDTPEAAAARDRIGGEVYVRRARGGPTMDDLPLSRMAFELVLMRAKLPSLIGSITVTGDWITIVRGEEPLTPGTFRYIEAFRDNFHQLTSFER